MRRLSSGVGVYFYKSNDFGKKERKAGREGRRGRKGGREEAIGRQSKAGFIVTFEAKERELGEGGVLPWPLCGGGRQEQGHLSGEGGEGGQNGYPCNLNCK